MKNKYKYISIIISFLCLCVVSFKVFQLEWNQSEILFYRLSFVVLMLINTLMVSLVFTGLVIQFNFSKSILSENRIMLKKNIIKPTLYILWYLFWIGYLSIVKSPNLMAANVIISIEILFLKHALKSSEIINCNEHETTFLSEDFLIKRIDIQTLDNNKAAFYEVDNPKLLITKNISK